MAERDGLIAAGGRFSGLLRATLAPALIIALLLPLAASLEGIPGKLCGFCAEITTRLPRHRLLILVACIWARAISESLLPRMFSHRYSMDPGGLQTEVA